MSIAVAKNVVSVGLRMGTNRGPGLSLMETDEGEREGGREGGREGWRGVGLFS